MTVSPADAAFPLGTKQRAACGYGVSVSAAVSNAVSDDRERRRARTRLQESAAVAEVALACYCALAAAGRLDSVAPELARSLSNLGTRHGALGHQEAALAAAEEAVRLLSPFFLMPPARPSCRDDRPH